MSSSHPPGRSGPAADRSGNVMMEFALALPILTLLMVGLIDLGSFGLQKSAMLQGARAGAQYGILVCSNSDTCTAQSSNINSTAQGATGLSGVTATNSPFCECVTGTTVLCSTTCGSGQTLKRYITVNTTKSFSSVLAVATLNFGSFGSWTPPTSVSASVTMIVP
jgi:Flp pilus assembly protein TadG